MKDVPFLPTPYHNPNPAPHPSPIDSTIVNTAVLAANSRRSRNAASLTWASGFLRLSNTTSRCGAVACFPASRRNSRTATRTFHCGRERSEATCPARMSLPANTQRSLAAMKHAPGALFSITRTARPTANCFAANSFDEEPRRPKLLKSAKSDKLIHTPSWSSAKPEGRCFPKPRSQISN